MADTLLISTYELGYQPFGLASPAAWLGEAGADVQALIEPFNQAALSYPWKYLDRAMDDLYVKVFRLVRQSQVNQEPRISLFNSVWQATLEDTGISESRISEKHGWDRSSKPVPRMSESWY